MRHLREAEPKVESLLAQLEARKTNGPAGAWLDLIRAAYAARPQHPGGLSGWTSDNDSKNVDTLQVDFDERDQPRNLWVPGSRNMHWNPLGARFLAVDPAASERRFSGVYTLASSDDTYIGYAKDFGQIIVFHTVE